MKIAVLDDDEFVLHLIATALNAISPDIEIALYKTRYAIERDGLDQFDLLVSDLSLPDSTPFATAHFLLELIHPLRIVVFSAHRDCMEVMQALSKTSSFVWVSKESGHKELRLVLERAVREAKQNNLFQAL